MNTALDSIFMVRALELATLGQGRVSPNPLVGCVIVHNDRIIGEGWHQQYGGPHAEVNAVCSVTDESLLAESTVYVTLEPCSHFGKTPPCADLLIEKRVKRVVICNSDPNPLVAGRGLAKLQAAGIRVEMGLLEEQGYELNRRFFTHVLKKRPYLILKWAETADGFLGPTDYRPLLISSTLARQLVHKWRAEEDAVLVGTNTAHHDNPRLNIRYWTGCDPVRIVIDKNRKLSNELHLFDRSQPTLAYTFTSSDEGGMITWVSLSTVEPFLDQLLADLYQRGIQSVIVEGGISLLEGFLDRKLWDEARIFKSSHVLLGDGLFAPVLRGQLIDTQWIGGDLLMIYRH